MPSSRSVWRLAPGAFALLVAVIACESAPSEAPPEPSAKAAASARPSASASTAAAPSRSPKTKLTSSQLEDAYEAFIDGNLDTASHTVNVATKLGEPQKVEGDKSTWYGIAPKTKTSPESCVELYTSESDGSGKRTSPNDNCFF